MKKISRDMEMNFDLGNTYLEDYEKIERILDPFICDKGFLKSFRSTGDGISLALHIKFLLRNNLSKNIFLNFFNKLDKFPLSRDFKTILNKSNLSIINFNNLQWSTPSLGERLNLDDVYESAMLIFDSINNIVEGILKHLINILYFIETINTKTKYKVITFGEKVTYLSPNYPFLLINNISISQWRNISDHKDYRVINNRIIGEFSKNRKFNYSLKSLIRVLNKITLISNSLYVAFTIFFYNNLSIFSVKLSDFKPDVWMNNLKIGLGAQNYRVVSYDDGDVFTVTIKDCLANNDKESLKSRVIQSSQYGVNFWAYVRKDIRLICLDNEDRLIAIIKYKNRDFLTMENNNLEVSYMARKMIIEFISKEIR